MANAFGYLLRLPKFEYLRASSVREACFMLSAHRGEARLLAGGTDLLVCMKRREIRPRWLINIKDVPGLDRLHFDGRVLHVGALATLSALTASSLVREVCPLLGSAARQMCTPSIRRTATVGGNLCHAAPSADMAPPLLALGADMDIAGLEGERRLPAEDYFVSPGFTALQGGEMLTGVRVPTLPEGGRGVYLKLPARTRIDIALAGVAVVLVRGGEKITDVRIALGAVAPIPMRAREAEALLEGRPVDDLPVEEAAETAASEARPISDIRGTAAYRREMVKVLTRRAVLQAVEAESWEGGQ